MGGKKGESNLREKNNCLFNKQQHAIQMAIYIKNKQTIPPHPPPKNK